MQWSLERVQEEISTFEEFTIFCCNRCKMDWFCPSSCTSLRKAETLDFSLIQQAYFRNNGDLSKVFRYIRRKYKERKDKNDKR